MEVDVEDVLLETDLDLLGSVGVLQRVEGVLEGLRAWTDVGNHDSPAVASDGVLEKPGQLGVTVGNVLGSISQGVDAISKSKERLVDVGSFSEPGSLVTSDGSLLAASQVNQTHLGHLDLGAEPRVLVLQLDEDLQHGVGPAALGVGVRGVLGSVAVPEAEQGEDVVWTRGFVDGESGYPGLRPGLSNLKKIYREGLNKNIEKRSRLIPPGFSRSFTVSL